MRCSTGPVLTGNEQGSLLSRTTLNKVEKGDRGVAQDNYAQVLFVLGLAERVSDLADVRTDALELERACLPQRIRRPRACGCAA